MRGAGQEEPKKTETPFAGEGGGRLETGGTDDEDVLAAEDLPPGLVEKLLTAAVIGVAVAAVLAYLVAGRPQGHGRQVQAGTVAGHASTTVPVRAKAHAAPGRRGRETEGAAASRPALARKRGS